ncbi:MAG: hypothetical protein Q9211_001521 [Gyalolechia sp. 1 TL-2023]
MAPSNKETPQEKAEKALKTPSAGSLVKVVVSMPPPPVPAAGPRRQPHRAARDHPTSSLSDTNTPPRAGDSSSRRQGLKRAASSSDLQNVSKSQATSFPESVKKRIRKESSGDKCWYCGDAGLDVAHVIASSEKNTFTCLTASGLITLRGLQEDENGLPLCPSCHRHFDMYGQPDWVFFPEDLEYFIKEERTDFARRKEVWEKDKVVASRKSPTAAAYAENQRRRNKLLPGAKWGSYDCYTGVVFGPEGREFKRGYHMTKWWHGDPMAALQRAFRGLNIYPLVLPEKLGALQVLYRRNDRRLGQLRGLPRVRQKNKGGNQSDDESDNESDDHEGDPPDVDSSSSSDGPSAEKAGLARHRQSLRLDKQHGGGSKQKPKNKEGMLVMLSNTSRKPTAVLQEEPFARSVPTKKRRKIKHVEYDPSWEFGPDCTTEQATKWYTFFHCGGYVDNGPWAKPGGGIIPAIIPEEAVIKNGLPSPRASNESGK